MTTAGLEAGRTAVTGRQRVGTVVAVGLIGLVGLVWLGTFGGLTIDDAFITWRYARNLVDHGIWNYNPSYIDLVEAYTNPSFAFLAIIPAFLGISVEAFFKFFMGALGIVFVVWMWRRPVPVWQRIGLLVATVANPVMYIHWFSGLETGLWIMLLTLVFVRITMRGELGWLGHAGLLLLALTRPEGLGYLAVLVVWSLLLKRTWRQWLQAGVLLVVLGTYWVARTMYFGRLLPNTFYAKTADHATKSGLLYGLLTFVLICVLVPLLVLYVHRRGELPLASRTRALFRLYLSRDRDAVERARWTPVLMAVLGVGIQFVVYNNSSLQMDYANRFAFQLVLPVLLVCLALPLDGRLRVPAVTGLVMIAVVVAAMQADAMNGLPVAVAALGIAAVMAGVAVHRRRQAVTAVVAAVALAVSVSMLPVQDLLWMAIYRGQLHSGHVPIGKVLARYAGPDKVMVVHDAGVTPYEAGWETIDVYGLATRRITDGEMTVEDLARINPDVVIADRFIAKRYLAKYRSRYVGVEGTTIYVLKSADPQLRKDLMAVVAENHEYRTQTRWDRLLTTWPSTFWLTDATR